MRTGLLGGRGSLAVLVLACSVLTACKDKVPPTAPTNLTAVASGCAAIGLRWGASTDAGSGVHHYNVYQNGAFRMQVLAPATSVTDTGLRASTLYAYTVIAVDKANNGSGLSNTASAWTGACVGSTTTTTTTVPVAATTSTTLADGVAPSVPTGLTAAAVGCRQVNLAWNAAGDTGGSGLASYLVYRNDALLAQVPAPSTSTSDTTVAPSSTYGYRVAARDAAGNVSARSAAITTTTPACPTATPGLVGFVPGVGAGKAVALVPAAGLAYVASIEFGLAVVDVANPSAPRAVGGARPPFYGEGVAVAGTLALVPGNSLGLAVVDVSDRTAPRTVGRLPGTMKGVAAAGSYGYALQLVPGNPARTDVVVVDLRNPAAPAIVGRATVAGGTQMALAGAYVFVAAGTAGLQVVDVSNPTAPRLVATRDTPGNARAVAVSGSWAYVADETSIQVVDATVRTSPAIRAAVPTSATAVAASGTRLYALGGGSLKVVDVASPLAPALRSTTSAEGAQGVAANGNLVYLASPETDRRTGHGGLYVVDATNATSPVVRANAFGGFESWGVALAGTTAVATGNDVGLRVVDVGVSASPRVVGALAGTMKGVVRSGSYAYVMQTVPGNPPRTEVVAVDLRTPAAPAVVGRATVGGGAELALAGTRLYVAAEAAGLQVVDISSPASPRLVGTRDTPGSAADVAAAGTWAYVADGTAVLAVDVGTPSSPAIRGSLPVAAKHVAVAGTRLYALGGGGLVTIDVSTPSSPRALSTTSDFGAQGIDARGSLLFLATPALNHFDPAGGVYALDVSGTTPRLVTQIVVPGTTRAIAAPAGTDLVVAGDTAAVVDVVR